jgi:uncharacterized protein (TIGR02646 family)
MIAIEPYFEPAPQTLSEGSLRKKKYKSKWNPNGDSLIGLVIRQQATHVFDDRIYGAADVKQHLETIFHHKCAFCECSIRLGAHYDVEHFRPKKIYYWLGYEWTSLLISCHKCNRDHKGSKFPLFKEQNRIQTPPIDATGHLNKADCHILSTVLSNEEPLLLHPALDDPKNHLNFLKSGEVEGLTPKGIESIQVYGLNREELVIHRKNIIAKIRNFILYPLKFGGEMTEKEMRKRVHEAISTKILEKMVDSKTPFIGFMMAIWEHFDEFIIENTDEGILMPYKPMMKQVYNNCRNLYL